MRCPACGFTSFPHLTVCKKCGKPLPTPAAATQPPAPARPSLPKAPPRLAGPIAAPAPAPARPPTTPPDPFFVSGARGSAADTVMLGEKGHVPPYPPDEDTHRFTLPPTANVSAHSRNLFDPMAVPPSPDVGLRPAGLWIRYLAITVDHIVLMIPSLAIVVPRILSIWTAIVAGDREAVLQALEGLGTLMVVVGFLIPMLYEVGFVGWRGQTPGKMLLGLKIIRADGGEVDYIKSFIRWIGKMISGLLLGIGYIMAAFTENKRALHDYIAGTRVVHL